MAKLIIFFINIYQKTISPDHGVFKHLHPNGFCKYYPSCSEYTKQAVEKHGVLGVFKGIYRILRCNPWSRGGMDLVK